MAGKTGDLLGAAFSEIVFATCERVYIKKNMSEKTINKMVDHSEVLSYEGQVEFYKKLTPIIQSDIPDKQLIKEAQKIIFNIIREQIESGTN